MDPPDFFHVCDDYSSLHQYSIFHSSSSTDCCCLHSFIGKYVKAVHQNVSAIDIAHCVLSCFVFLSFHLFILVIRLFISSENTGGSMCR